MKKTIQALFGMVFFAFAMSYANHWVAFVLAFIPAWFFRVLLPAVLG